MRILVGTGLNQGTAEYQNIGDIAMLQVAVARLAELWPGAEILVLTDSEAGLARFCPQAKPLSRRGAETWVIDGVITGPLHLMLPEWITVHIRRTKRWLRTHAPGSIDFLLRNRFRLHDGDGRGPSVQSFVRALRDCDLLVIAGCGGFADSCRAWNLYALGLIEAALAHHKKVALFGQGLGPLADAEVLGRMREVLPRVSVLASRGTHGAEALAEQLGIPQGVFTTTGDDAVEPAYRLRSPSGGNAIGVNLRIASYSGISETHADAIGAVLREFAARQNAELIPLPIALHRTADDRKSIGRLLGESIRSDGMPSLDAPEAIYSETAKCRVVVTGAYHAAVFALAQGIPTICISAAGYYAAKFEGLRTLFGNGCVVVNLQDKDSICLLRNSLESTWERSIAFRDELLDGARKQIEASLDGYRRIRELLDGEIRVSQSDPTFLSIP
jgi:colanic acid/amylovoran biosynthesis protein